jgi:hypothetical protein
VNGRGGGVDRRVGAGGVGDGNVHSLFLRFGKDLRSIVGEIGIDPIIGDGF